MLCAPRSRPNRRNARTRCRLRSSPAACASWMPWRKLPSLKQQIADEQLQTVLAQLELGNGSGRAGRTPQLSPKTEQLARIDERQKFEDALDAGFDLARRG